VRFLEKQRKQRRYLPKKEDLMSIDRYVMAFAGGLVLVSLLLSLVHSQNWLYLTAFVGANLFQAAFTGFCPLALILKRIGVRPGQAFR
jgi:fatty acid desaturase